MSRNNKERTGKKDTGETPPVGNAVDSEDLLSFVVPTELVDLPHFEFVLCAFWTITSVANVATKLFSKKTTNNKRE